MAGDTISVLYDKTNGKLQFEFINHPDGSWTVWQWDTQDVYAWAFQVFNGTGQNTLFNVTIQNKDGSTVYDTFDLAHGDAVQQATIVLADKTWTQWTYDTAGVQAWSSWYAKYTAAGQITVQGGTGRDGTTWINWYDLARNAIYQADKFAVSGADHQQVWDTGGGQAWSIYVKEITASGQVASQVFTNRDGTTTSDYYDLAHGDTLQVVNLLATNGTTHQTVFDTAATSPWSYYVADLDASGRCLVQSFGNRDGTQTQNVYDPVHGYALQSSAVFQVNGALTYTVSDTSGSLGWSGYVGQYGANNGPATIRFTDRDGSTVQFSYNTTLGVKSDTEVFSASGVMIKHTDILANGDVGQFVLDALGHNQYEIIRHADGSTDISQTASQAGHSFQVTSSFASGGNNTSDVFGFADGSLCRITADSTGLSASVSGGEARAWVQSGQASITTVADNTTTQTTTTTTDHLNIGGRNGITIDHSTTSTTTTTSQTNAAIQNHFWHDALSVLGGFAGWVGVGAAAGAACTALGLEFGPGAVAAGVTCARAGAAAGTALGAFGGGRLGDWIDHTSNPSPVGPTSWGDPTSQYA